MFILLYLSLCIKRLGVTLAVDVVVCTHECVCPVGRRPQSAGYEQFGGGSRAAGSVIRLVHWKNAQVTYSAWSRARTPAAVFFHVTVHFQFYTKTTVQCCWIGQLPARLSYFYVIGRVVLILAAFCTIWPISNRKYGYIPISSEFSSSAEHTTTDK